MPLTRKQQAEMSSREGSNDEARRRLTFDEPPASPSAITDGIIHPTTRELTTLPAESGNQQIQQEDRRPGGTTRRAPSVRPGASSIVSRIVSRIAQAELQAQEHLAMLKKKELEIEAELVKKRLAVEITSIREEEQGLPAEPQENVQARIDEWLHRSVIGQPKGQADVPSTSQYLSDVRQTAREDLERGTVEEDSHRPGARPPSPRRGDKEEAEARQRGSTPNREKGIDRLAEVLEKMTRQRPAPRQAYDLPVFSGAPLDWLAYKAAMRDSTELYRFTRAENLARLRASLRGEAKEAVSSLLFTATEPDVIMKTLEQCFGRPEVIIDRTLEEIRKLRPPGATASELNAFAIKIQNIVCTLSTIDNRGYLRNPMLAREIVDKLSPHIKARWCDYADANASTDSELRTLAQFLMQEADRALRHAYNTPKTSTATSHTEVKKIKHSFRAPRREAAVYNTNAECLSCNEKHATPNCPKIKAMDVNDRWKWAKQEGICFRCFNSKHRRQRCSRKACGVNGCVYPHHQLLHNERDKEATTSTETVGSLITENKQILLKICPVQLKGPKGIIETYALCDEGSSTTIIDQDLAENLGAEGPPVPFAVSSINAHTEITGSRYVSLQILTTEGARDIRARTMKGLALKSQKINGKHLECPHLRDIANEICTSPMTPKILIGSDFWELIVTRKLREGSRGQPVASLTKLGWIINGSAPRMLERDGELVCHIQSMKKIDDSLHNLVREHFATDSIGIKRYEKPRTPSEQRAVEIFQKSVKLIDGRYQVALPWREENVRMPPSFSQAYKRLKTIERKMDRSTEFQEKYTAQIENLLEKGYAVPADGSEELNPKQWFLPHFAVTNPNKPGKIRLVFDARAKLSGETSLNSELLEGPDLLRNLAGILWRFREEKIAVHFDIKEMFLRIKIEPEDRAAQMFLWRGKDRQGPPRKYKMVSMIFGARSSPFLAHSVRDFNALKHKLECPRAVESITTSFFMDDFVESFESEEEAVLVVEDVIRIHSIAGFELAGCATNSLSIRNRMPQENCATNRMKPLAESAEQERTLGLCYESCSDLMGFNTSMSRVPQDVRACRRPPTKREALSAVMSTFDPLGLLSYYVITAKIILQRLWRMKMDWDDPLPPGESELFQQWLQGMAEITHLRIPRRYFTGRVREREIHTFVDASESAVAAVVFWRAENELGEIQVSLAAAKAKVSPMMTQTIPKLELQGALIGTRLTKSLINEHRWKPARIIYWSDSMTVLQWIRNPEIKYTPFVANRVTEINEETEASQWRWVPTAENVADDATRLNFETNTNEDRWFIGPQFLYKPESEWPQEDVQVSNNTDEYVLHVKEVPPCVIDMKRFSKYERLLRTMGRVYQFIENCRQKTHGPLSHEHIERAETWLIRQAQSEDFKEEIYALRKGSLIPARCSARRLTPFLDAKGLLRASGRASAADAITVAANYPIILSGRHPYTRLLVARAHRRSHHGHNERVVNDLRQQYFIFKLRPTVRGVARNCALCRVRKTAAVRPIIGDLPRARMEPYSRPFSYCGIDYFGPMTVTIGRRHEKRWGALFTCLTTRAIHIELVASLSTDSAIMAMRRMASRRGWPRVMYSDNATNFKGADQELRSAMNEWEPALRDYTLNYNLVWRTISPGAPWQGGSWERMIQTVKRALRTVLSEKHPKEEILQTLLAEVEFTVNARPLTHVPVTREDPEALTPNHFLLGGSMGLPTLGPCEPADRKTWRAAQGLADEFWRRWVREYLPILVPRNDAPKAHQRKIAIDDLVVVVDKSLPRNLWPKGIVIAVHPGTDGEVRNCTVRTASGVFRRPAGNLAVLPKEEEVYGEPSTGRELLRTD